MNYFDRKGWQSIMGNALDHWHNNLESFGTDSILAIDLIYACWQDYHRGFKDPGPWLALCDLIEEHGRSTAIRYNLCSVFKSLKVG